MVGIPIVLGILFYRRMLKETKELYDFFDLTKTQDIALNKFFKAKTTEEQDSAWIDVELTQMEIERQLEHKV